MPRPLGHLLAAAGLIVPDGAGEVAVERVVYDSRSAAPGALFVAIPGSHVDGHAFARQAVLQGAVAVVAEHVPRPELPAAVPLILTADSRTALAPLAAAASDHPSRSLCVVGVTGTDGKTTTTTMLHAAWRGAGIAAGSLSTIDFRDLDEVVPNPTRQTTLEASDLQERMRDLLDRGRTHVALETSSHALSLHRVDAVDFRAAVYTRVTSEHLDFHRTREAYLASKRSLLERVAAGGGGIAVLDRDDGFAFPQLAAMPVATRLTYSVAGDPAADLVAESVQVDTGGLQLVARTPWGTVPLSLHLAGRFNAGNALAALGAACATGAALEGAAAGLARLEHISGRMEPVDLGQGFGVVIDYAHTAEALRSVLAELRAATEGRLWVVFGSAGERDREKRPAMGAVAARLCDRVVLCDEDPREEDRAAIIAEIAEGARAAGAREGETLFIVPDRDAAIAFAIDGCAAGDTVLLAGKGHERSILSGARAVPWDERGAAETALRRRLARAGTAS
jgi:UDP-N-acetylmuramoyl-L-alanyl-D-glutamate--2,6-diaminopimelate ligase